MFGGDGGSRTRVRKLIPETFYERSLSIGIPYGTADKQAFLSVVLLCVTDYKTIIRSHLLLNDTPYRAAVLSGECSPLIKQQEVLFRFCRLFLINRPFYSGQTPLLAYRSSKSPSKSFHPHIYNYEFALRIANYLNLSFMERSIVRCASFLAATSRLS